MLCQLYRFKLISKNPTIETNQSLDMLIADFIELIQYARQITAKQVNLVQLMTYYSLGKWIVEEQQEGKERAKYGKQVLKKISESLTKEFGRGFSETNLEYARKFYFTYADRISQTVFEELDKEQPFLVSWSHYLQLMRIENADERKFYEIESAKSGWGIRTLQRQYNSSLCNGYFRVKYTSNQEYCTRIYRDTSTTCNEYASRKSYKEKLFSHPIHTEFTKSYNRLYARIRRGKLPADTPLMDQLKALHDEYTEKYENTHQKDREAIWKEYIEKNKELLKLDSSKS